VTTITSSIGQQIDSYKEIKEEAYHHFSDLYQEPIEDTTQEENNKLLENIPSLVTNEENIQLTHEITEEEIHKAIWRLDPDKASEPDSFPIIFFRHFWDVIKKDMRKMLN
jgi:hypothetical protein